MNAHLKSQLGQVGLIAGENRWDDKFTAVLEKELEFVKNRTYDIKYTALKARTLIPAGENVNPGAETITYRQWDEFGTAAVLANYADDLPLIDSLAEEFTSKVIGIGAAYQWSVQDLKRAAMSGESLDRRRATSARRSIEQQIENVAAFGNSKAGLTGFTNNANVPLITPIVGSWTGATTGAVMIADVNKFVNSVVTTTKEIFPPDTLLFDVDTYTLFASTRISTTGDTHTTALQAFLASSPWITSVSTWNSLRLADAGGTGPRAVCYKKDPEVVTLEIPQEIEILPPQAKNLSFQVPMHARVGGCIFHYPMGVAYMDGL